MAKAILILLDGLRFDVAQTYMGFMGHLVETSQASLYKVQAELPALSRPLYEVLLTGTPVSIHGITTDSVVRLSHQVSVFHLARQQGLTTAAAAYHWFSELYNRSPFNPFVDREQHDVSQPIQHGKFYFEDCYPDSHLFIDAEVLRQHWNPDFLVVNPLGLDYVGQQYGSESKAYRGQAIATDGLLAHFLPLWRDAGYTILITADHGIDINGQDGGTTPDLREVPLYCLGEYFEPGTFDKTVPQMAIAPLLCSMLGVPPSEKMRLLSLPGYTP